MKTIIYLTLIVINFGICFAQQASDYFTVEPGLRWQFISVPLDTSGNEIDSLSYCRWDLFFSESEFEGLPAKILITKSGPAETISFQPYVDSIIYHLSGTIGYEYFKLGVIKNLIFVIDSLISDSTFSILSFLQSMEQWYPVYRFAQPIGVQYEIFHVDTTVTIDTLTLPLRLEYLGTRLQDEAIETGMGTFDCKKFDRTLGISYLIILPPPLPPIQIPIIYVHDYIWIAQDLWIVQGLIPSIDIDLSFIGQDTIHIPALLTKLDKVTAVEKGIPIATDFTLEQNYPNPFNPSTTIRFAVTAPGFTTLKIYNSLGEAVAILFNKELTTGTYEVEWNASGLPSGVYYYTLNTEGIVETKKMILIK
jgi:hypothetical protein